MEFDRYLRNRPFLVITMMQRPQDHVRTEQNGWAKLDENWKTLETTSIVDRVNDRLITKASLIIDILKKEVVVNHVYRDADNDNNKLVEYYLERYQNQVNEGIALWEQKATII